MNTQEFWNWINSLNPIEVSVDEEGNISEEDLEQITHRITEEVQEIKDKHKSDE